MSGDPVRTAIFLHIPKTGGKTLDEVFARHYAPESTYSIYEPLRTALPKLAALPAETLGRIRLLRGHFPFGLHPYLPQPADYFTMLRDPIDRVVSFYYFVRQTPDHYLHTLVADSALGLADAVRAGWTTELDNGQTRLLAGLQDDQIPVGQCRPEHLAQAQDNIEQYFVVCGLTERFDDSLILFKRALGWNRLSYSPGLNATANRPRLADLDRSTRRLIEETQALDVALYPWAAARFRRQARGLLFHLERSLHAVRLFGARLAPGHVEHIRQPRPARTTRPPAGTGMLEHVHLAGGIIRVDGWAAARGAGAVSGFNLAIGESAVAEYEMVRGLPRPEPVAAHPELDGGPGWGFHLRIPLTLEQQAHSEHALLAITPLFGGRTGRILLAPLGAPLPEPGRSAGPDDSTKFAAGGLEQLAFCIQAAGLQPTAQVLDVGCGYGALASALSRYLKLPGRYAGFDVRVAAVRWATTNVAAQHPHFTFQHVDVRNRWYNPTGQLAGVDLRFPWPDASFDLVTAFGLWPHLAVADVRRYLAETWRVLRRGGRCVCSVFLLNHASLRLLAAGKSSRAFRDAVEGGLALDAAAPEAGTAFDEAGWLSWAAGAGFVLVEKDEGSWCGRSSCGGEHDLLVLYKPPALSG
jgi:SAM-dependent methyltransferase